MIGGAMNEYSKMKYGRQEDATLVSEQEFIEQMVDNGAAKESATFQAKVSKTMGSVVKVGDKYLKIK